MDIGVKRLILPKIEKAYDKLANTRICCYFDLFKEGFYAGMVFANHKRVAKMLDKGSEKPTTNIKKKKNSKIA